MLNKGKNSEPKLNVRSNLNSKILRNISLTFILTIFSLSVSAQGVDIWALSSNGGTAGKGMITNINTNGNAHQIGINCLDNNLNEKRTNTLYPENGLIDGNDGFLYGTTSKGGVNDVGVFYKINKASSDISVVSEIDFLRYPGVSIAMDDNSEIVYGFATYGGEKNKGSIFSYNKEFNSYKELYSWNDVLKGAKPMGQPVIHDGYIYGVTEFGGKNESGVLFRYSIEDEELYILKQFEDYNTGGKPYYEFVMHNNRIYGTTEIGGKYDGGTIYCYDLNNNKFTTLYHFIESDGKGGRSLTLANDSYLVGSTIRGGQYDLGVIYTFNISTRAYTKKIDFDWNNNGAYPEAKLVETDKYQYVGYTTSGGVNGTGVYFSYDLEENKLTKHFDFENENGVNTNFNALLVVKNDENQIEKSNITTELFDQEKVDGQDFVLESAIEDIEFTLSEK